VTITLGTQTFFWLKVVLPQEPPTVTTAIPVLPPGPAPVI
jgi:hypothetical protein